MVLQREKVFRSSLEGLWVSKVRRGREDAPVYENTFSGERRGVLAFYCGSSAFPVWLLEVPQGLCTAAQGRGPEATLGCSAGLLGTHLSVTGHWVRAGNQVLGPAVRAELGQAVPCL